METKKKRPRWGEWIRWGILAMLVVIAGGLALADGSKLEPETAAVPTVTPGTVQMHESERDLREKAYVKDLDALQRLLEQPDLDAATRNQAVQRLEKMVADHQSELGLEQALIHQGFEPCLVLLQNGALTVMVAADGVTAEQSASILAICMAHTDIGAENIRIMTGQ